MALSSCMTNCRGLVWVTRAVTRGSEFPSLYSVRGVQVTSWIESISTVSPAKLQSYRTMLKPTGVVRSIDGVLRGCGVEDVRQSSDLDQSFGPSMPSHHSTSVLGIRGTDRSHGQHQPHHGLRAEIFSTLWQSRMSNLQAWTRQSLLSR